MRCDEVDPVGHHDFRKAFLFRRKPRPERIDAVRQRGPEHGRQLIPLPMGPVPCGLPVTGEAVQERRCRVAGDVPLSELYHRCGEETITEEFYETPTGGLTILWMVPIVVVVCEYVVDLLQVVAKDVLDECP